ncbi:hypothetical protein HRG_011550 [Hirsutella rhossiliensis]|uniref:Uncharacterized protein n=1 Tax=Hirsutella rhossiliensis TaxID=111463 RepID=A0A9P8MJB3_9HYPO|nr:uncharacterized protein HRG_11550 [Hirsutella rhossiliensis]KAH0957403.1 hypothetical protein HRG_11550 [Hirsutella rhossiliensis]
MMTMILRALLHLQRRKKPPRRGNEGDAGTKDKHPQRKDGESSRAAGEKTAAAHHHIGASRGEASVAALALARTSAEARRALPGLRRDMRRAERLARRSSTVLA